MTYSSSLAMSRTRYAGRNQNAVSFQSSSVKIGPISNTIILIVLACLLGLLYLTQVTKTNAYGYQISDLQARKTQLQQDQQNLAVTSARLQSMSEAKATAAAKGMVSIAPSESITN